MKICLYSSCTNEVIGRADKLYCCRRCSDKAHNENKVEVAAIIRGGPWDYNRGRPRAGPKQAALEAEFGEPFVDILIGFAKMGYGKATTAKILEYNTSSFLKLLKHRVEWDIPWPQRTAKHLIERPPPSAAQIAHCRAMTQARVDKALKTAGKNLPQPVKSTKPNSDHPWRT